MNHYVIDTNVILVANSSHTDVSEECVIACVTRLNELMKTGILVIDDAHRIFSEYEKKTSPRKGKGPGDIFLKWAFNHQHRTDRVHQVEIREHSKHRFAEFPDEALEDRFDPSDRVFVAVSNAHAANPPIVQATDSKWIDWWEDLQTHGVEVDFICKKDICRFYEKKFKKKKAPVLP